MCVLSGFIINKCFVQLAMTTLRYLTLNDFTKAQKFFWPYLKSSLELYRKNNIGFGLCREILSDNLPMDEVFICEYFKTFPERLDSKVLDVAVDTTLRMIIHDVILSHASEYITKELHSK